RHLSNCRQPQRQMSFPYTTLFRSGGVLFIAATKDEKIRAFDKDTGEILWEAKLPAAGHATPAVYEIEGKQFLVIACGGGKGTKRSEEHTSELQSRENLVCRLLLEK